MFIAKSTSPTGREKWTLGLVDENCRRLLADKPILHARGGIARLPVDICITYAHDDGEVSLPVTEHEMVVFSLTRDELTNDDPRMLIQSSLPKWDFFLFRAHTEEQIKQVIRPLVKPGSVAIDETSGRRLPMFNDN